MTSLQKLSLKDISEKLQGLLDKLEFKVKHEYSLIGSEVKEVYDSINDLKKRSDIILNDIIDSN